MELGPLLSRLNTAKVRQDSQSEGRDGSVVSRGSAVWESSRANNTNSLSSVTDLEPSAPQTSRDATECKSCGAPQTTRGILQFPFHIWQWNHHTGSYSSLELGHRPPPLALSKFPTEKKKVSYPSCDVMKDMFTRVTSVTLRGNRLSSFLMTNKQKAQAGLNIAWREQQVIYRILNKFQFTLICFQTLTWLLSAESRAELGVFSAVARWGSVSSSSLLERQSPKILQVSPGFCVKTWFYFKVQMEGHSFTTLTGAGTHRVSRCLLQDFR